MIHINDTVYVIQPASDDHYGVTVIPAKVRRIIHTEEADALGVVTETTSYLVAYDGEGPSRNFHPVNADGIVHLAHYEVYGAAAKVGTAILSAIATQVPAPPVDVGPPPAVPAPATTKDDADVAF